MRFKKILIITTLIILLAIISLIYIGMPYFKGAFTPKAPIASKSIDIGMEQPPKVQVQKEFLEIKPPIKYPNLRLEGTVIDKDPTAYIRNLDTKDAKFYSIGDAIANAKLIDIKRGEATLDMQGHKFTLYIESDIEKAIQEISDTLRLVMKNKILEMIDYDIEKAKAMVQVKPKRDREGKFSGYAIDGIKDGSLAYLAGLRNGDVIKEVNNQKLTTPQKAIQTFKRVRRLKDIELTLLRNDKKVNLKYKVK